MLTPDLPIHTERLDLRPLSMADLDAFADLNARPAVVRYLYWDVLSREESADMLVRRVETRTLAGEGDALHLGVVLRTTRVLVGHVVLQWVSDLHRTGEVGFVFHPDHHGRGYATEAMRPVLDLGFRGMRLHRIVGRCDARNTASAKVMERLGMVREAHLRESEWVKGEWTDELVFAILEGAWRSTGR
jgi:RimJ/RimL family protein N-acetyltransferase